MWVVKQSRSYAGATYFYNTRRDRALPSHSGPSHVGALSSRRLRSLSSQSRHAVDRSGQPLTKTVEQAAQELRQMRELVLSSANPPDKFIELATQRSDCSSLGNVPHGKMHPPFEEAAFALRVGEISDVVATPSGLHLIMRVG